MGISPDDEWIGILNAPEIVEYRIMQSRKLWLLWSYNDYSYTRVIFWCPGAVIP
jgi:hypothetical protein